jgi:hypothetical protein
LESSPINSLYSFRKSGIERRRKKKKEKKELKKAILGIILVLLITMMSITQFVKSFDIVYTIKDQQSAVDLTIYGNLTGTKRNPVISVFTQDEISGSVLDFLRTTKPEIAYRPLSAWGESVESIQTRWSQQKWFIQECHQMNIKVIPVISTLILKPEYFNSSFIEEAATRNVTDDIVLQYQADIGNYYYHGSLNHAAWREPYLKWLK